MQEPFIEILNDDFLYTVNHKNNNSNNDHNYYHYFLIFLQLIRIEN